MQFQHVICKGTKTRLYGMIPIGTKKVFLKFAIPRILCSLCGVIRQVRVGFAEAASVIPRVLSGMCWSSQRT